MSTIVSVQKDGRTAVAWDGMNRVGDTNSVNATAIKAFRAGDSVIAMAGYSVYQVILPDFTEKLKTVPTLSSERAVFQFFLSFWRALHEEYHFVNDASDSDQPAPFADLDAEFLVANKYGIFLVKAILSVSRFDHYCAIGSGAPHAEGALRVLYDLPHDASDDARRAVEIACEFDCSSGGPVHVLEIV